MTVYVYIQPSHRVKRENKKERRRNERQYTRTRMFLFFSGWQKDKRDLLFCFLFLRNNLQFHVSHLLIFAPLVYSACSPSISCSPHFLVSPLAWKRCSLTVRHKTKQPRTHKRDPFPIVWWWPSLYASFCVSFPFQNFSCFKRGGQDYKTLPRIQLSDVFLFEFGWNERKARIYRIHTALKGGDQMEGAVGPEENESNQPMISFHTSLSCHHHQVLSTYGPRSNC